MTTRGSGSGAGFGFSGSLGGLGSSYAHVSVLMFQKRHSLSCNAAKTLLLRRETTVVEGEHVASGLAMINKPQARYTWYDGVAKPFSNR